MPQEIQLIVDDNTLYWPPEIYDEFDKLNPSLIDHSVRKVGPIFLHRYPEGDCDTVPWPWNNVTEDKKSRYMGTVIYNCYDARETGMIPADAIVLLPNGVRVEF